MAKSKKTVGVVLVISFTTLQKKKFNMLLGLKKKCTKYLPMSDSFLLTSQPQFSHENVMTKSMKSF
jgi:hypothetical protein